MSANTLRTKRPKIAILGSDLCPNMPGSCSQVIPSKPNSGAPILKNSSFPQFDPIFGWRFRSKRIPNQSNPGNGCPRQGSTKENDARKSSLNKNKRGKHGWNGIESFSLSLSSSSSTSFNCRYSILQSPGNAWIDFKISVFFAQYCVRDAKVKTKCIAARESQGFDDW